MERILSVVTARAGSKGVVGKNFKDLNGKPLVWWSIKASEECMYMRGLVGQHPDADADYGGLTVVSSNCPYVKQVVDDIGAPWDVRYIPRPDNLCTDLCSSEEALIHAYEYAKDKFDFEADTVVLLQPTSPIRRKMKQTLLDLCLHKFFEDRKKFGCDSLVTVKKVTPFFMRQREEGKAYIPDGSLIIERPMRQSLSDTDFFYHDCGNIYITDIEVLLDTGNRLGADPTMFVVSEQEAIQVDTKLDFKVVEEIMQDGYGKVKVVRSSDQ